MKKKPPQVKDWWKPVVLVGVLLAFLAAAKVFNLTGQMETLGDWIKSLGAWGPAAFVLLYIVAVVVGFPSTLLTFLAGAAFGTVLGVVLVSIGATIGACLAFLIGRYFARDAVEKMIAKNPRFKKMDRWTASNGVWVLILVRLVPVLPINLTNYAFGLTRVGFWPYALWSWLCMIPAIIVYVAGADAVHQGLIQGRVPWGLVGIIGGLVALLAVLGPGLRKKVKW